MGIGDNIMATGMARGAAQRGRRIAFGDGRKIIWDPHSRMVFRGNPNIASPGTQDVRKVEWIEYYRGHRIYNRSAGDRWIWNYNFRPTPGEIFLSSPEQQFGERAGKGFIVIEPNVPAFKNCAPNKQWPFERYEQVAAELARSGHVVLQFVYAGAARLKHARAVSTPSFRHALAVLGRAALYIGAEGGLHHGAAAVGIPAVVLFGGFVPPQVTGYATHTNLTGGAEACGMFNTCRHCIEAMQRISAEEVTAAAGVHLGRAAA